MKIAITAVLLIANCAAVAVGGDPTILTFK
jgi:hypothetical protein